MHGTITTLGCTVLAYSCIIVIMTFYSADFSLVMQAVALKLTQYNASRYILLNPEFQSICSKVKVMVVINAIS